MNVSFCPQNTMLLNLVISLWEGEGESSLSPGLMSVLSGPKLGVGE